MPEVGYLVLSLLLGLVQSVPCDGQRFLELLYFVNADLLHLLVVVPEGLQVAFLRSHPGFV